MQPKYEAKIRFYKTPVGVPTDVLGCFFQSEPLGGAETSKLALWPYGGTEFFEFLRQAFHFG